MSEDQKKRVPNNHVLAVLSGEAAADVARKALEREGYETTVVFRGDEVAETIDPKGEHSGPLGFIVKAVEDHLSEEQTYLAQYQEEARAGKEVVAVPVEDRDHADAARDVLERHGAQNIRYFGTLAVHDLTPETNPSTRAAESPAKYEEA
jgi:hypothetical protein